MILLIVVIGVSVGGILFAVGIYNQLVALRNRFKNAWAQIDVQLKRRYDLIPNLVETAKSYLKHERETLESVIAARNQAVSACQKASASPDSAQAIKGLMGAEGQLMGAMGRFNLVVEAYPDLKADKTMSQLSEELTSTENRISFARQAFNDSVMVYNTAREKFPNVIFAGAFNFQSAELFEITNTAEREAPKVKFG
jgi:LemA protein